VVLSFPSLLRLGLSSEGRVELINTRVVEHQAQLERSEG